MKKALQMRSLGPVPYSILAVCVFTYLESGVKDFVSYTGLLQFVSLRVIVEAFVCIIFLSLVIDECKNTSIRINFHPRQIDEIIFYRAISLAVFEFSFAFTLVTAPLQIYAYPLYFLHPIWQLIFAKSLSDRRPTQSEIGSAILIFVGVIVFVFAELNKSAGERPPLVFFLISAISGAAYSVTNEMVNKIYTRADSLGYKFTDGVKKPHAGTLRLIAHTYIASIYFLVAMSILLALIWAAFYLDNSSRAVNFLFELLNFGKFTRTNEPELLFRWFQVAILLSVISTWLAAQAFAKTTETAKMAAIDGLALLIAYVFDYWKFGLDAIKDGWVNAAMVILGAGILAAALPSEKMKRFLRKS